MDLRFSDRLLAGEKIEIAALVGLADMLGEHRAVAARIMRRRRPPGGAPAGKLLLADVQMDAARGDVDLDLIGSGTVSGPEKSSWGSLLELTARGREPIALPSGETRGFIEDGDEIIFRGSCAKQGFARIGFCECRAVVLPAG